jgi:hypothetical protein
LHALPSTEVRIGLVAEFVGPFLEERQLAGELDLLGRSEVLEIFDPPLELDDLSLEIQPATNDDLPPR